MYHKHIMFWQHAYITSEKTSTYLGGDVRDVEDAGRVESGAEGKAQEPLFLRWRSRGGPAVVEERKTSTY